MFKRRWLWLGRIVSDEGFEVFFGHKSAYFKDGRGRFEFGYEDGKLSATPYQVEGELISLTQEQKEQMVHRVVSAILWEGRQVEVFRK